MPNSNIGICNRHKVYGKKLDIPHQTIKLMFVEKSLTEIDKRIIPKTLLIIPIPFLPRIFSIVFDDLRIIYTNNEFITIAIITLIN